MPKAGPLLLPKGTSSEDEKQAEIQCQAGEQQTLHSQVHGPITKHRRRNHTRAPRSSLGSEAQVILDPKSWWPRNPLNPFPASHKTHLSEARPKNCAPRKQHDSFGVKYQGSSSS